VWEVLSGDAVIIEHVNVRVVEHTAVTFCSYPEFRGTCQRKGVLLGEPEKVTSFGHVIFALTLEVLEFYTLGLGLVFSQRLDLGILLNIDTHSSSSTDILRQGLEVKTLLRFEWSNSDL
jgi:hypothetical protein